MTLYWNNTYSIQFCFIGQKVNHTDVFQYRISSSICTSSLPGACGRGACTLRWGRSSRWPTRWCSWSGSCSALGCWTPAGSDFLRREEIDSLRSALRHNLDAKTIFMRGRKVEYNCNRGLSVLPRIPSRLPDIHCANTNLTLILKDILIHICLHNCNMWCKY